jgi:putative nucleotidyltransferase with HDIG domain
VPQGGRQLGENPIRRFDGLCRGKVRMPELGGSHSVEPMQDTRPGSHRSSAPAATAAQSATPAARRRRDVTPRHRLAAAFEAFDDFPALSESRDRLRALVRAEHPSTAEIVAVIESDIALTVRVLRQANLVGRRVESIVKAVGVLSPRTLEAIVDSTPIFDFFYRPDNWDPAPERMRLHAIATQRAADRIAREVRYEHRDRLMISALLHDIGKLVLTAAYPAYPDEVIAAARTPEERARCERQALIVDHALVGGALARRWGLPDSIATGIERHHAEDATGDAAFVRLADMLAHFAQGRPVVPQCLQRMAAAAGLSPLELRAVMHDLPFPDSDGPRAIDPCPLSTREAEVLKHLADGKSYRVIAAELSLLTSTVRTHLASIYRKLAAVDRAQAVLIATKRGWL